MSNEATPIPLSAINHYLFCKRRAYLIHAEGVFIDNEHTLLGNQVHEVVDAPGYEHRAGWELLRALPLFSDTLRLSGKADIVEVRRAESKSKGFSNDEKAPQDNTPIVEARPVEYKKGPSRRWSNDHAQLCAQALCLEEMFGLHIKSGLVFHASSAKRDEIIFDSRLRELTIATIDAVRTTLVQTRAPRAVLKPQCDGCSLHSICMPETSNMPHSYLFEPRNYS